MHVYKRKELERVLGISATTLRALIRGKHIHPRAVGAHRSSFTFQELILMRTATTLRAAGISSYKIDRTLRHLRRRLPADAPLSGITLSATGKQISVSRGAQSWDAESGQYQLSLDMVAAATAIRPLYRHRDVAARAGELFDQGYVAEADDPAAAIASYEKCLTLAPRHREARINLGRLLHQTGKLEGAAAVYAAADVEDSTLSFNLAIVLEDLGRESEAIDCYHRALVLDPCCVDAHYNLARLHDAAGRSDQSLQHLIALRRLSPSSPP